jgi:hypothetical protein
MPPGLSFAAYPYYPPVFFLHRFETKGFASRCDTTM